MSSVFDTIKTRIRAATISSGDKYARALDAPTPSAGSRRHTDAHSQYESLRNYGPIPVFEPLEDRVYGTDDTVIHLIYDSDHLPPQMPGTTRFVCISDTHSQTFPVPEGDVLLHTGDMTGRGKRDDFEQTLDWLKTLPHKVKIIIGGNHDLPLHRGWYDANYSRFKHHMNDKQDSDEIISLLRGPEARAAGIVYLDSESHHFQLDKDRRTWSVYGSPWQPAFNDLAFNYQPGNEAHKVISQIPTVDILLTHGPPKGILDRNSHLDHCGCPTLLSELGSRIRPRLHAFGHIHEDHGAVIRSWEDRSRGSSGCGRTPSSGRINDETVFVNGANAPTGSRAKVVGDNGEDERVPFAGRNFQPVLVDIRD